MAANMHFAEHGIFEVKVEGNCLFVDATGPFNEELTKHYQSAIEVCIEKLEASSWDQVITLRHLSLFTPEAEAVLINTLVNRKKRGLKNCAVVLIDIEGKSLITHQMHKIYQTAGVKHEFFESIKQAKHWLNDSLDCD